MKGRMREWPPILPRLPVVRPKWSFPCNVMIWDVDVCCTGRRIAAASSDCNVYVLSLDGTVRTRFEMPSQVTQVRFLEEDLLACNGRRGSLYGLRLTRQAGCRQGLELEFEANFARADTDVYGVITTFSVDWRSRRLLVGYGNPYLMCGGIACVDFSGNLLWQHQLQGAVVGITTAGNAITGEPRGTVGLGTMMIGNSSFVAFPFGDDGRVKEVVRGARLISIAGVSRTSGAVLLGVAQDDREFQLVTVSPEGREQNVRRSEAFPVVALLLEEDSLIVAPVTPLQEHTGESLCGLHVWRNGDLRWTRRMVRQVFRLTFDDELQLFFVSSMGQGNVYAISPDGEPLACAEVHLAPLCLHVHRESGLLLVGSKRLTAFHRDEFAQHGAPGRS